MRWCCTHDTLAILSNFDIVDIVASASKSFVRAMFTSPGSPTYMSDLQILGSKCFGDVKCPSKMHFGGCTPHRDNLSSSNIANL